MMKRFLAPMRGRTLGPPRPWSSREVGDPARERLLEIIEFGERAERGEVIVTALTGLPEEERQRRLFGKMPRE